MFKAISELLEILSNPMSKFIQQILMKLSQQLAVLKIKQSYPI